MRGRRLRRLPARALALVLGVAAVVAVLAAVDIRSSRYDAVGLSMINGPRAVRVPAWTQPCRRRDRRWAYTLPCATVKGRVLHVQRHDPDGDGDRHLVLLAGLHIVIVKIPRSVATPHLPGFGATVRATGVLSRGRAGLPVIDVARPPLGSRRFSDSAHFSQISY
jgi:hypothetical protein